MEAFAAAEPQMIMGLGNRGLLAGSKRVLLCWRMGVSNLNFYLEKLEMLKV